MPKMSFKYVAMIAVIVIIAISYAFIIDGQMNKVHFSHKTTKNSINSSMNNSTNNSMSNLIGDPANNSTNDSVILANMNAHKNLSYSLPNKPAYILRLDDVQSPLRGEVTTRLINDTLSRNMSISVAVILSRDSDDEYGILALLRQNKDNPHLEITQHGFSHTYNEYANLSANDTQLITMRGLRKLYQDYGVCPITFIPPNNQISNNSTNALESMGFRIISTRGDIHYDGSILDVGHNAATTVSTAGKLYTPSEIMSTCENDFKKQNLSVIMIHPQDFVGSDHRTLDPTKYANYIKMLDKLNNTKAQSITFRDLLKGGETM